jgi:type 1 glutamine amidotransferase
MENNTSLFFTLLFAVGFFCCGEDNAPGSAMPEQDATGPNVLVYTKTAGFRHESIEKGVATLRELGAENGFAIVHSEDSLAFSPENLKKFRLVIFLSTTMNVLGPQQEEAFKGFISAGGAYMGIHAAADTEYEWDWYGKLAGAYFKSHPKQQEARIEVVDQNHPSTRHLPAVWTHFDEWYNFKDINPEIRVLMKLDESSYEGGENNGNHPIAWCHEFGGGRSFYTGLGHTEAAYDDAAFRQHLLGGILWCLSVE